jgi:sugar lactone lactonase YvrE
VGNGQQFNAPGNFLFDAQGNVWVGNNYVPTDDVTQVCGGRAVLKLYPYEAGQPVSEFYGGGVNGVGFGVVFDRDDNVWVSNYGFKGSECTETPPSNSLSQFTFEGVPLSPDVTGFTQGPLSWPQGMALNDVGDIFTASCGNDSVVVYRNGDPNQAESFTGNGLSRPFDVGVDSAGNSWITNIIGNNVSAFTRDGTPLNGSPFADGKLQRPLGIAIDSNDSKWIANSITIKLPCGSSSDSSSLGVTEDRPTPRARITHIDPRGNARNYFGGGLTIPWGIAVDGNDQVWVADFAGQRVSRFCGTKAQTCPRNLTTGDNISGKNSYGFDGLQRNTGVGIDQAGNVWLANNWKPVPVQSNPGGDGMVVLVGAAAPVN